MDQTDKTVRVRIRGRVQGVWYRGWTQDTARQLGLIGWVRNRKDGSVEAVFSGPETAVEQMLEKCWQGPPAARVDTVDPTAEVDVPMESGFAQKPTLVECTKRATLYEETAPLHHG